jgi:membrane protein implicated in regulation of membrane protease activity
MAQLIFLLVLLGGSWLLYRKFVSDAERLAAKNRAREKERETDAIGTLVQDPETGEYRLRREDDED